MRTWSLPRYGQQVTDDSFHIQVSRKMYSTIFIVPLEFIHVKLNFAVVPKQVVLYLAL